MLNDSEASISELCYRLPACRPLDASLSFSMTGLFFLKVVRDNTNNGESAILYHTPSYCHCSDRCKASFSCGDRICLRVGPLSIVYDYQDAGTPG